MPQASRPPHSSIPMLKLTVVQHRSLLQKANRHHCLNLPRHPLEDLKKAPAVQFGFQVGRAPAPKKQVAPYLS